ncbi:MAG: hypothetical protein SchgKO_23680 [Schleiferiaceae bacterium]
MLYSCKKDITQNPSSAVSSYSTQDANNASPESGDDWWCFVFDYGANGTDDWCPPTSIVCNCLKEVVVTAPGKQVGHPLIDNLGDAEFLANYAASDAWLETFSDIDVEENTLLPVARQKIIDGAYTSTHDYVNAEGVHHLNFHESNGESFTLRLRVE